MDSRPRTASNFFVVVFSIVAVLEICAMISSCDAADRSIGSVETGQSRDLINQPECWTREYSDEWYRCSVGGR